MVSSQKKKIFYLDVILILYKKTAVSAQYNYYDNYYAQPLQAINYGQQAPKMEVLAPIQVTQAPITESYESYRQEAPKMTMPQTAQPERTLTRG